MFAKKFSFSELLNDVILNQPDQRVAIIDWLESEDDFDYLKKYLESGQDSIKFDMDRINNVYDTLYYVRYDIADRVDCGPENEGDPQTFEGGKWSSTLYECWGIFWWQEPEGAESGFFKSKEEAYKDFGFLGWG